MTHRSSMAILIAAVALAAVAPAAAVNPTVIETLAAAYESQLFLLKVGLHEPVRTNEGLHAPMLDEKGWHYRDPSRPVVLRAGTRVEVTGLFNYAERGMFLELAEESGGFVRRQVRDRSRIRVRLMVEAAGDDPDAQRKEAAALLERLLSGPLTP